MRHWQTSALFRLAVPPGPIFPSANPAHVVALSRFVQMLGEAYQKIDDCGDIRDDTAHLIERLPCTVGANLREFAPPIWRPCATSPDSEIWESSFSISPLRVCRFTRRAVRVAPARTGLLT